MSVGESAVLADRYALDELIGSGGMADVYRAHDRRLSRDVAVKVLRDVTGDTSDMARFQDEARTVARLSHPTIVTVLDAGLDEHRPFLVLELVDGPSLAAAMSGPLGPARVAELGAQIAGGLAHAHEAGVVHRDVKPANILLGSDGRARLTDFGVARLLLHTTRHTRTGVTIGSPAYLSPEQVRGEDVTGATDVYSLGLVLLEALTGRAVYRGTPTEVALARLHAPPRLPPGLPPRWAEHLAAMTSLDPRERPLMSAVATWLSAAGHEASGHGAHDANGSAKTGDTQVLPVHAPPPAGPRETAPMQTFSAPGPAEAETHLLMPQGPGLLDRVAAVARGAAHRGPAAREPMAAASRSDRAKRWSGWVRANTAVVTVCGVVVVFLLVVGIAGAVGRSGGNGSPPPDVPTRYQQPLRNLHRAIDGDGT